MPGAISSGGPGRAVLVRNFKHRRTGFFAQSDQPGVVRQIVGISTQHTRDAVLCFDIARDRRDDKEDVSTNDRVGRQRVIERSGKAITTDVLSKWIRIVELHELEIAAI